MFADYLYRLVHNGWREDIWKRGADYAEHVITCYYYKQGWCCEVVDNPFSVRFYKVTK